MKILVVDDDRVIQLTIAALLTSHAHQVDCAFDGADALRRFQTNPTDLVITDIIMPEMEGVETIVRLRRLCPDLPIIAMSGGGRWTSSSFLSIAGRLGADSLLPKPFTEDELLEALHSAMRNRRR